MDVSQIGKLLLVLSECKFVCLSIWPCHKLVTFSKLHWVLLLNSGSLYSLVVLQLKRITCTFLLLIVYSIKPVLLLLPNYFIFFTQVSSLLLKYHITFTFVTFGGLAQLVSFFEVDSQITFARAGLLKR